MTDPVSAPNSAQRTSSIARALSILTAFTPERASLSASELGRITGLSRPTLYRLLATLESCDFVASDGEPLRFRLGPAVAGLASTWNSGVDIIAAARRPMQDLWTRTRETVVLFGPSGFDRICLFELASPQPLSFRRSVGFRDVMTRGATGRAIFAFMAASDARMAEMAAAAGLGHAQLMAEIDDIRRLGYAFSANELIPGAAALAAPIFQNGGAVVGSVGLLAPEARLSGDAVDAPRQMLCEAAIAASAALGMTSVEYRKRLAQAR